MKNRMTHWSLFSGNVLDFKHSFTGFKFAKQLQLGWIFIRRNQWGKFKFSNLVKTELGFFLWLVEDRLLGIKVPLDLECFFEHSKKPSKEQTHSKKHSWEQIHFFESSKKCSKKFHRSKERLKKCSCEWSTQKRVGYSKKYSRFSL